MRRESDKGLPRTIDVRRSLGAVQALDDAEARRRLDWPTGPAVRFSVSVSHEGSARPVEVMRALFGDDVAAGTELARLGLWAIDAGGAVDPLSLELLRRVPAGAAVAGVAPGGERAAAAAP